MTKRNSGLIDRRSFLQTVGGATALAALPASASPGEMDSSTARPNVVFFLSDDHSIEDSGCYGSKVVRTPNIDRIATEGMRFTRAFTPTAMCSPSRSALYTGLSPHRNGCHMNHGKVKPGTRSIAHYMKDAGYRVVLANKKHIGPATAFPFEYIGSQGIAPFLQNVGQAPFCLVIASSEPHGPHATGGYKPEEVEVPPYMVDTPMTRQALANYYTDIDTLDREVGECLELLEKHNLAENTLFFYGGDHGNGIFVKWTCYEAGLNVPFIVRWPGRIKAGAVSEAMVSFVDVLPTILDAAGQAPPASLDGKSFLPVLTGKTDAHRDIIFGAHTTHGILSGSIYPVRSVRTATHKYIRNLYPEGVFENVMTHGLNFKPEEASSEWKSWCRKAKTDSFAAKRVEMYQRRPAEELYDLRTDPHELSNIASDPANKGILKKLGKQLDTWMKQQGDEGLEAERKVKRHPGVDLAKHQKKQKKRG
ncbi:sulfatase [Candidatus Hydrogenedentota bacterium]